MGTRLARRFHIGLVTDRPFRRFRQSAAILRCLSDPPKSDPSSSTTPKCVSRYTDTSAGSHEVSNACVQLNALATYRTARAANISARQAPRAHAALHILIRAAASRPTEVSAGRGNRSGQLAVARRQRHGRLQRTTALSATGTSTGGTTTILLLLAHQQRETRMAAGAPALAWPHARPGAHAPGRCASSSVTVDKPCQFTGEQRQRQ
jgi:hypothetical protein